MGSGTQRICQLAILAIWTGSASADGVAADAPLEVASLTRTVAGAERTPAARSRSRRRFSNGPRRVPRPRGASRARAQRLAIGGLTQTRRLLRGRAAPQLLAEARGEAPRKLLWPVVDGKWGRGFGFTRKHRTDLRHNGVDIGAPEGAPVRAAADGIVVYSDNALRGFGNAVIVLHPNGWTTLYAHNQRNTVQPGWRVKRGERIALVGATGIAWGPHLHFELRDGGRLRDPGPLFVGKRTRDLQGPLVELQAGQDHAAAGVPSAAVSQAEALSLQTGLAAARRLLAAPAEPEQLAAVGGRSFRTLLWPLKGGQLRAGRAAGRLGGIVIEAEAGAGARTAADGAVIYTGDELPGLGSSVVLLHRSGWVTLVSGLSEIGVQPGDRVLRGQWLGRASGEQPLRFVWLDGARSRDPLPLLVGIPAAPAGPAQTN